jgi:hypothetical protein
VFGDWSYWGDVIVLREDQISRRTNENAVRLEWLFNNADPVDLSSFRVVNTLRNVINANQFKQFADSCSPECKDLALAIYAKAISSDLGDGFGSFVEQYYSKEEYFREFAFGMTMQKMGADGCSAAYRGHAVDVDIEDAYGRLYYTSLESAGIYSDSEHRMIKLSTERCKDWRRALTQYASCADSKEAKSRIASTRWGGLPHDDFPPMRKLCDEMTRSVPVWLSLPENTWVSQFYKSRRNPMWSRLCAALSKPEASVVKSIQAKLSTIDSTMYCNKFDGGVFSCWPAYKRILIEKKLLELSAELKVNIVIKPWVDDVPVKFCQLSRIVIERNDFQVVGDLYPEQEFQLACLFFSVGRLRPGHRQCQAPGHSLLVIISSHSIAFEVAINVRVQ